MPGKVLTKYYDRQQKQGAVRANVQTLIALFTPCFFMFQYLLSNQRTCENERKSGFNSVIDRQIRVNITPGMIPPLEPSLTPFRTANPDFLLLIIAGFAVLPEGYI